MQGASCLSGAIRGLISSSGTLQHAARGSQDPTSDLPITRLVYTVWDNSSKSVKHKNVEV